jgi:hypothetical protein
VSRIGVEVFDSQTDIATALCPFDQATQDDYVAGLETAGAERIIYSAYLSAWVIARYDDIDAFAEFDHGAARKYVLDPHGMIGQRAAG